MSQSELLAKIRQLEEDNSRLQHQVTSLSQELDRTRELAHLRSYGWEGVVTAAAGHHERAERVERAAAASHHRLYGDWREHSGSIRPSLEQVRQEYRQLHPEAQLDVATTASLDDSYADQLSSDEEIKFTPLTWQKQEELDQHIKRTVELATEEHSRRLPNWQNGNRLSNENGKAIDAAESQINFQPLTWQEQGEIYNHITKTIEVATGEYHNRQSDWRIPEVSLSDSEDEQADDVSDYWEQLQRLDSHTQMVIKSAKEEMMHS